jgi:hypothetical protein
MHDCMTWSPEEQVVYHCSPVHVAWKMYIQTLPALCSFKLCSLKELKKENHNTAETSAKFFLVRMKAQWDNGARKILLGEGTRVITLVDIWW